MRNTDRKEIGKRLYTAAIILYLISGIGHLTLHFIFIEGVKNSFTGLSMKLARINFLMFENSLYSYFNGFSLIMGIAIAGMGFINFAMLREFGEVVSLSKVISGTNTLLSFLILCLSIIYLSFLPVVLYSIITILFAAQFSLIISKK